MVTTLVISHPPDAPVRLLQITDAHLGSQPGSELLGLDTDFSLDEVLKLVRREHPVPPQLVLCTGDISSNGTLASYRRFHKKLQVLRAPMGWLAGNHDNHANMAKVVDGGRELSRVIDIGNWRLLLLNSQIPKKPEGRLGTEQRSWLAQQLEQAGARHVMVCLHHHVLPVGCDWLDSQRIADADEFLALLTAYPAVKLVLSGHVHQHNDQRHAHLRLLTTPSSCIQFAERSSDFRVDTQSPGYRWFELLPDGAIKTGVSRVTGIVFSVDQTSSGYE